MPEAADKNPAVPAWPQSDFGREPGSGVGPGTTASAGAAFGIGTAAGAAPGSKKSQRARQKRRRAILITAAALVVAAGACAVILTTGPGAHNGSPAAAPTVDPGCSLAEPAITQLNAEVLVDQGAIGTAANNNDGIGVIGARTTYIAHIHTAQTGLEQAESQTYNQALASKIADMITDQDIVINILKTMQTDSMDVLTNLQGLPDLTTEKQDIDDLCK